MDHHVDVFNNVSIEHPIGKTLSIFKPIEFTVYICALVARNGKSRKAHKLNRMCIVPKRQAVGLPGCNAAFAPPLTNSQVVLVLWLSMMQRTNEHNKQ